jgi:hypothetical protein
MKKLTLLALLILSCGGKKDEVIEHKLDMPTDAGPPNVFADMSLTDTVLTDALPLYKEFNPGLNKLHLTETGTYLVKLPIREHDSQQKKYTIVTGPSVFELLL